MGFNGKNIYKVRKNGIVDEMNIFEYTWSGFANHVDANKTTNGLFYIAS
jgi:hypothetical protein